MHHHPVQIGFHHIGRSDTELKVHTVGTHQQKIAVEILEHILGKRTDHGYRTLTDESAKLHHIYTFVLRQERRR